MAWWHLNSSRWSVLESDSQFVDPVRPLKGRYFARMTLPAGGTQAARPDAWRASPRQPVEQRRLAVPRRAEGLLLLRLVFPQELAGCDHV